MGSPLSTIPIGLNDGYSSALTDDYDFNRKIYEKLNCLFCFVLFVFFLNQRDRVFANIQQGLNLLSVYFH